MQEDQLQILVADDEEDILDLIEMEMSTTFEGAQIHVARSGNEAIEVIKKHPINFIFCDYNMPDGSGGDVFRFIVEQKKEIPYVMISTEDPSKVEFDGNKITRHISKPFAAKDLSKLIKELLSEKGTQPETSAVSGYTRLSVKSLKKWDRGQYPLYIKLSASKFIKMIHAEDPFDEVQAERVRKKNIQYLYLKKPDYEAYFKKHKKSIESYLNSKFSSVEESFEISGIAVDLASASYQEFGWNEETQKLAHQSVKVVVKAAVSSEDTTIKDFLDKLSADPDSYLASHSTMSGFLSCAIAKSIGKDSEQIYYRLTAASMLHDMALKPYHLENLDNFMNYIRDESMKDLPDVKEFRSHPVIGSEMASSWEKASPEAEIIILQHHELPQGGGFPTGVSHERIAPLSAIFIVAEDLADFLHKNPVKPKLEEFLDERRTVYKEGKFKEIFDALVAGLSGSKRVA